MCICMCMHVKWICCMSWECACHFFAFLSTITLHYVLPALDCAPVRLWCSIQKNSHLCQSATAVHCVESWNDLIM